MENAQTQYVYVFSNKSAISNWIPKSGWNASFFPKDKIVCAAYYRNYREKHIPESVAETMAFKKVYEMKYEVAYK